MAFLGSAAFRNLALVGATVAAIGLVAVFGFNAGGTSAAGIGANPSPAPSAAPSVAALDQALVAGLMQKIQANPNDADSLMALGDEYYRTSDFKTAGDFFTKVTAVEPTKVRGFLALGATAFNQGDSAGAEKAWKQAVSIDAKNVEAHYDLGFLYLNATPTDLAGVKSEWGQVVALSPEQRHRQDGAGAPRRARQHGPRLSGSLRRSRRQPRCVPRRVPGGQRGSRNSRPLPRSVGGPVREPAAMTVGAGIGLVVAFLAGVVSFASPCCLPLVPAYIGYMVGATGEADRRRSFIHGLAFVGGFTLVFVTLWVSIGLVGYALADYAQVPAPDRRDRPDRLRPPGRRRDQRSRPLARHAPDAGVRRLLRRRHHGWWQPSAAAPSPWAGPAQGCRVRATGGRPSSASSSRPGGAPASARSSAGSSGSPSVSASVAQGTVLLLAYAAGLAVPFLAVAMGATWVASRLGWVTRHQRAVSLVSGAMLVGLGFLMVTNLVARLAALSAPFGV